MLNFLPSCLLGAIAGFLLTVNVLVWVPLLLVFAIPKFLLPIPSIRRVINRILHLIAENWIACNSGWMRLTQKTRWDVRGLEGLDYHGWYLVVSNHQTWVDILVMQHLLNRRIPLLKFFIKRELIKVPLMGLAWWALDYPFLYRHSAEYLEKHPEQRGKDYEATRLACEKFSLISTSVMNFLEGTRFTRAKHARQKSEYTYLLRPKAGGLALALNALGDKFHSVAGYHHRVSGRNPDLLGISLRQSQAHHRAHEDDRSPERIDARRLRRRSGLPRCHAQMGTAAVAGKR